MKIILIQPKIDARHGKTLGYGSKNMPPETGLAVIAAWTKAYSKKQHNIKVLNPNSLTENIIQEAAKSDIFGISSWYSNHKTAMMLAKRVKEVNQKVKIVIGGPNASKMPDIILKNHPYIDFVVIRDGEDALLGLADDWPLEEIPNLCYRKNGKIKFTKQGFTNLTKMPLWDYEDFENKEERIREYLEAQKKLDPWLVAPLALFSFRGCLKAILQGPCSYCTSAETVGRALPATLFWKQVSHLNKLYGAELFYIADDIFTISTKRIAKLAKTKPKGLKVKLRAYSYINSLAQLNEKELKQLAKDLKKIGVFNLFYGVENYNKEILAKANKEGVETKEVIRVMQTLYREGSIKTTMAFIFGLEGESEDTLQQNIKSLRRLLGVNGCIERIYQSVAMPLRGSALFNRLVALREARDEYFKRTGKDLVLDDDLDYDILSALLIKQLTKVSVDKINAAMHTMTKAGETKLPKHRIGGFMEAIRK